MGEDHQFFWPLNDAIAAYYAAGMEEVYRRGLSLHTAKDVAQRRPAAEKQKRDHKKSAAVKKTAALHNLSGYSAI